MVQQAEAHPSLCTDPGGGGVLSPAGHVGAMLLLLVVKHIRQDMAGTLSLAKPVLPRRKTLLASAAFASTPAAAEQQQRQHCVTLTRDQRKSGPCAPTTPRRTSAAAPIHVRWCRQIRCNPQAAT